MKITINQKSHSIEDIPKGNVSIKKLILENFLSFKKDEISISNFNSIEDPQLILIIGPNWSGKTSIFQGFKFVFGSNERDERYSKWSDFIRDGQHFAMVEVHLEFNGNMLVIRRTVIKGKSPYYEIKRHFKQKFERISVIDMQNLISDLRINPDNHFAFVSQGKIDALKNLKPIELCNFLEEGIGLKGLRNEILSQKDKLDNLKINFDALKGRRNVLNKSLDMIKPKLKRLEKKQVLKNNKKILQDELLWANRYEILQQIKEKEGKVETIVKNLQDIQNKIEKIEETIYEIQNNIKKLDIEINLDAKQLGKLNYIESELSVEIKDWEKEKKNKKEELERLEGNLINLKNSINAIKNQKIEKNKILLEESNQISTYKREIDELIKEQNNLSQKVIYNESEFNSYENLLMEEKNLKSKINIIENQINDFNSDVNDIFQSLQEIEEKLEKNKWFLENPSSELLKEIDIEINSRSEKMYSLSSKLKNLENQKALQLRDLNLFKKSIKNRKIILPTNIIILKDEITKRGLEVKGPLIDYLKYEDRLSYAIESVLGERTLFSFTTSDWETFIELKKLKKKFNAYCNIYLTKSISLRSLPNIENQGFIGYLADLIDVSKSDLDIKKVLYSKIGNCIVIQNYTDAQDIYEETNFKGRMVTLKGEQIRSYKYVFETPFLKKLKGFLSTGTLKDQIELIERKVEDLTSEIRGVKTKQTKLDQIIANLYRKKEIFNDLLYNFNQKQRFNLRRDEILSQTYLLEKKRNKNIKDFENIQTQIEILDKEMGPKYKKWKQRLAHIPDILEKLNKSLKNTEKVHQNLRDEIIDLEPQLGQLRHKFSSAEKDFTSQEKNFKEFDKKAYTIFKKMENVRVKASKVEEQLKHKKIIKNEQNNEIKELMEKQNRLKVEIGSQKYNLKKNRETIKTIKLELERIEKELESKSLKKKIEIRTPEEIEKELKIIEKELLGYLDVDETLLQERDEILSNLKELSNNLKNLEDDIRSAIITESKMEETYYSRFNGELNNLEHKINEKFSSSGIKTYCTLQLKGSFEDLGIEIKAAVSMDQLKSCKALSGGQISMVSICLILSLQEIRPSPLCMFDEAAMFLDEKNTEITYQMIKTTLEGSKTQLIMFLPTSSKTLFSLADKIIGVARVGKNNISTIFEPKIIIKEG